MYDPVAFTHCLLELSSQNLDGNARQATLQLHETLVEGGSAIRGREKAECAFVPDVRCLNGRAVRQNRQQRENGALREIGVFEEAARLAYNLAKLEVDRLNVGLDPRAAGRLKGVEQTIAMLEWG